MLRIRFEKLRRYMDDVGTYEVFIEGDEVRIRFKPASHESQVVLGEASEINIYGRVDGDYIVLEKAVFKDGEGRVSEFDVTWLEPWLSYVEEAY